VWAWVLACLLVLVGLADAELPETKRVNSVKSLTHILSLVEEANGDDARFTTMKLQIHLEDVYISQGDAVQLRPADLAQAIGELLAEGKKRPEIAKIVQRRYQDGEFHEK
jgi:hypothetical protein